MVSPQNTYLSKRKRVLMTKSYHIRCPKCNNNHSFYRYGKDSDGYQKYLCRNCHHQFAPDRPRSEGQIVGGNIRLVPCAERPFCITITNTIPTTDAAIRSAIIPFSSGNRLLLLLLPCPRSSASTILSECVILSRPSSRLYPCFISARTLSVISA